MIAESGIFVGFRDFRDFRGFSGFSGIFGIFGIFGGFRDLGRYSLPGGSEITKFQENHEKSGPLVGFLGFPGGGSEIPNFGKFRLFLGPDMWT